MTRKIQNFNLWFHKTEWRWGILTSFSCRALEIFYDEKPPHDLLSEWMMITWLLLVLNDDEKDENEKFSNDLTLSSFPFFLIIKSQRRKLTTDDNPTNDEKNIIENHDKRRRKNVENFFSCPSRFCAHFVLRGHDEWAKREMKRRQIW